MYGTLQAMHCLLIVMLDLVNLSLCLFNSPCSALAIKLYLAMYDPLRISGSSWISSVNPFYSFKVNFMVGWPYPASDLISHSGSSVSLSFLRVSLWLLFGHIWSLLSVWAADPLKTKRTIVYSETYCKAAPIIKITSGTCNGSRHKMYSPWAHTDVLQS